MAPTPVLATSAYYAPGVVSSASKYLHVSGQPGTIEGTAPADYISQIHLALLNLHRVLAATGATPRDVVKLTLYIVDYDPNNRLHTRPLQTWLAGHKPAITLVPVPQLAVPDWKSRLRLPLRCRTLSQLRFLFPLPQKPPMCLSSARACLASWLLKPSSSLVTRASCSKAATAWAARPGLVPCPVAPGWSISALPGSTIPTRA